jgi:hypothetical protein
MDIRFLSSLAPLAANTSHSILEKIELNSLTVITAGFTTQIAAKPYYLQPCICYYHVPCEVN